MYAEIWQQGELDVENVTRYHLEPQTGTGFELKKGQFLRVIDPQGEQVSDLMAFARPDTSEWLSSGRSFDYNNTIYLTKSHVLYSNKSNPNLVSRAVPFPRPSTSL